MKLNNFVINKLLFSSVICIVIIFSFFFIFSLLGNLGESYKFSTIITLSLISALQILLYIPLFLFFLILSIFSILLRVHNEIIIILHYFSKKKFYLIFMLMIFAFTFLEINKNIITNLLEEKKINYLNNYNDNKIRLIIDTNEDIKTYSLIKKNHNTSGEIESASVFEIKEKNIHQALYSSNLFIYENDLFSDDYIFMKGDEIIKINKKKKIISNIDDILKSKGFIYHSKKKTYLSLFNLNFVLTTFFIFLILTNIFISFFTKKYLNNKRSQKIKYFNGACLVLYSYIVINLKLNYFNNIFEILAILFICVLIFKNFKYE